MEFMAYAGLLEVEEVPSSRGRSEIDVRNLAPPEPLQNTLETLESMGDDEMLVQINDRVPQHLFPMLEDRGYAYHSTGEDPVYTAIWK